MMNTKEKDNQIKDQEQSNEAWAEFVPKSSLQDDDPYAAPEIRTELPLPARPIVKGGFALALSASALLLGWILFQLAGGITWNKAKQSTQEQENQPVAQKSSSEMTAEEKLQWCLATGKCGDREDSLRKPTASAKVDHNATSGKKKHEELAARSLSRPQTLYTIPQDVGRPVRVSRYVPLPTTPPAPSPVQSAQPVRSRVVAPTPVELQTIKPEPRQQTPQPEQTPDPIALLAQASNLGIYTTGAGASPISPPVSQHSDPTERVPVGRLGDAQPPLAEVSDRPARNVQLGKVIPVTTRIKGRVVADISWVGNKTEQKFRIQTTEDVKAEDDNSIAIPKNTYLLAQINQSSPSGYVDVQILSAQINGQEKAIPTDAIIVQATDGEPLQAKVKNKGSGLQGTIVAAGLAGISEAASTINSAKIIVGDTTMVRSGENVGAAVVEGVTDSLSKQMSERVNQAARYTTSSEALLNLKKGTKLELVINEPLSL